MDVNPYESPQAGERHPAKRRIYDPSTLPLVALVMFYVVMVAGMIFYTLR